MLWITRVLGSLEPTRSPAVREHLLQPLSDVKVMDLTWHIAGPYATKLLADYGADVLKVERPGTGDPSRQLGPFPGDVPHLERSGTFLHLNTNKRSITLDLKTSNGVAVLKTLVREADVLCESFSPGTIETLGLGYSELERINPRLVICSVSNYGQDGPCSSWKATDMTIYAHSGLMKGVGTPEREPLKAADHLMEYQAGATAATAILGALIQQGLTGQGERIDVSLFEVACGSADRRMTHSLGYEYTGRVGKRTGPGAQALPIGAVPCKDGHVVMAVSPPSRWTRFVEMVGAPELLKDPRLQEPGYWNTTSAREEMDALLYPWTLARTKKEIVETAQRYRVAVSPVNSPTDVLQDPHLKARGFFVDTDHPEAGRLPYPGPAMFLDGCGWAMRRRPPLLGEHNAEVLSGQLGLSAWDLAVLRREGVI